MGDCPGHCGMFSSILGLCSVVKTRNVSRYCSCLIKSHGWSSMKAGPGGVSRKHNSALSVGSPCVPCCEAQLAEAVANSDVPTQLSFKLGRSFGAATGWILPQGAFLQSSVLLWSPGSPTRIHDVSIRFQCGVGFLLQRRQHVNKRSLKTEESGFWFRVRVCSKF